MHFDQFSDTIKACRTCLMCRHACTVGNVTQLDTVLPRGKALILYGQQVGLLKWDQRAVDVMYQCTNCHLCREWCVSRYDIAPLLLAARADIVEMGLAPKTALAVKYNLEQAGNPYGEIPSRAPEWARPAEAPAVDVLFYAGCTTTYRRPEMARTAITLIERSGVRAATLADESCCGEPLHVLGFRAEARAQAERTMESIRATGAHTVVCSCPSCVLTFRTHYPAWGVDVPKELRILHISEYLAEAIGSGKMRFSRSQPIRLTYHDPCSLGRELGVYDAPRQVLSAIPGAQFQEMRLNRQYSPCCGNGGGVLATNSKIAHGAGKNAGQVVLETGADVLITACPSCKHSLVKHVRDMEVLDIAELVERAL